MIELTGQDGQPLALNPAAIWHIRQANGGQTAIYGASGAALFVTEPYEQVLSLLRHHTSNGVKFNADR